MENKKKGLNLRAIIPLATAIVSLVFIVVGLKDYGFWKAQPTPGFFPIIIAHVVIVDVKAKLKSGPFGFATCWALSNA